MPNPVSATKPMPGVPRRAGLPAQFNNRHGVVDDWRGHRLSAPPRGYHWVQSASDDLLVAIVGGVIAQILLDQ
jgi:Ni/Co efflux regulator RcnB